MRRRLFEPAGMSGTTFTNELDPPPPASGYDVAPSGPVPVKPLASRAYGPAGTTVLSPIADVLRFAALHLQDPSLASMRVTHADVSIYGWLDAWCLGFARFDWNGGPVWGWDGLIGGSRSILRLMPEHQAAVVLLTNGSTGRAMYRSLFADLMASSFGITVPPLRLDPSAGAAGELSRFAGAYAWPDQRVEVTATARGLLIKTHSGEREALPLDARTFLVDSLDPDNPTITFGAFGGDGRPQVLYSMLWGLPRIDDWPA
jgi:CubicO group peptidase (beta-lactamase class C family)